MDEFFQLEQHVGQVQGLISLQFSEDSTVVDLSSIFYHEFPKPEPVSEQVKKPVGEGEDEEAAEEPPAEDADDGKPKWDPKNFKWTVTNRNSKNLAQIFVKCKGPKGVHEVKQSNEFGVSRGNQIGGSIDQFINKGTSNEVEGKSFYQQVIFKGMN